jgi:dipeptidyl aminopeptidase/acylaminoacyl peptidase
MQQMLEHLLALPELGGAQVSPDGRWVAWTWYNLGPTADVFVAPCDGSSEPIRLTQTDQDTSLTSWAPDSSAVLVEHDHDGDERVQVFRVRLETPCQLEALTEENPNYFIYDAQLHSSGKWLIYAANVAEDGSEIEESYVYRHDIESDERMPLAKPLAAATSSPQLNKQGSQIVYTRSDLHPAGVQAWLVDIGGQHDREIINLGAQAKVSVEWLPNGEDLLVLGESSTYRRVGIWHGASQTLTWLIDQPQRNIEMVLAPSCNEIPYAVVVEMRATRPWLSLLHLRDGSEKTLAPLSFNCFPLRLLDETTLIAHVSGSQQPSDIVRLTIDGSRLEIGQSLTRVWERTPLRAKDFCAAEDIRWKSVDGLEIQGWLYRAAKPQGTIVLVHGGPTAMSRDALDAEIQFYVSQGFHVLTPNYRGSTGFSLSYEEAIKEDGWGGREQDDIRTGIETLIALGIAQPYKVGITGTSYGGYSAWCAITRFAPSILAAAVPICGMTDLVVDYDTTRPDLRPYSEEMIGGKPEQVPQRYYERSPINFVQNIQGRLLIVQGLRDPNVSPENVVAVEKALTQAGISYEVLTFEDEGHGIYRPENLRVLYQRIAAFFSAAFAESQN